MYAHDCVGEKRQRLREHVHETVEVELREGAFGEIVRRWMRGGGRDPYVRPGGVKKNAFDEQSKSAEREIGKSARQGVLRMEARWR